VVYFAGQRMGQATPLDLHANARLRMPDVVNAVVNTVANALATDSTGEPS
jgi:hypothetical protein